MSVEAAIILAALCICIGYIRSYIILKKVIDAQKEVIQELKKLNELQRDVRVRVGDLKPSPVRRLPY